MLCSAFVSRKIVPSKHPSDIATLILYPYIFLGDIKRISYVIKFSMIKINFQRDMSRVTGRSALVLFSV